MLFLRRRRSSSKSSCLSAAADDRPELHRSRKLGPCWGMFFGTIAAICFIGGSCPAFSAGWGAAVQQADGSTLGGNLPHTPAGHRGLPAEEEKCWSPQQSGKGRSSRRFSRSGWGTYPKEESETKGKAKSRSQFGPRVKCGEEKADAEAREASKEFTSHVPGTSASTVRCKLF